MTDPAAMTRARNRLKHLLRDYADATTEYDPTPPTTTAGNTILPGRWHYFQELDHWLQTMRTCTCKPPNPYQPLKHKPACTAPMYIHLHERYIRPHARTQLRACTTRHLPPNSERATHHTTVTPRKHKTQTQAAPHAGTTVIAQWHPWVRAHLYNAGLDWLLEHMHAGDITRINLPPDLRDATSEREKVAA